MTPKQHLRYVRLAVALDAVQRGERFADLAFAAGYADQAHFSRSSPASSVCRRRRTASHATPDGFVKTGGSPPGIVKG